MPLDLKTELCYGIYRPVHQKVEFLKGKNSKFISWICPLLKPRVAASQEFIFFKDETQTKVYFLTSGTCNYVLPKYENAAFIKIVPHTCFGMVDFLVAALNRSG